MNDKRTLTVETHDPRHTPCVGDRVKNEDGTIGTVTCVAYDAGKCKVHAMFSAPLVSGITRGTFTLEGWERTVRDWVPLVNGTIVSPVVIDDPRCADRVVEENVSLLRERSRVGVAKYGTTLEGNAAGFGEFLQHMREELLDAANYAEKLRSIDDDNMRALRWLEKKGGPGYVEIFQETATTQWVVRFRRIGDKYDMPAGKGPTLVDAIIAAIESGA